MIPSKKDDKAKQHWQPRVQKAIELRIVWPIKKNWAKKTFRPHLVENEQQFYGISFFSRIKFVHCIIFGLVERNESIQYTV